MLKQLIGWLDRPSHVRADRPKHHPRTSRRPLVCEALEPRNLPVAFLPTDAPAFVDIKDTAYAIPDTGVYFVAPDGSDANQGTIDSPWTVQKAIREAPAGSTIVFRGGEYRGVDDLHFTRPLTLQPYPHEKAWIKGSEVVTGWVADGNAWRRDGWEFEFPHLLGPEYIDPNFPLAGNRDMVFIDGRPRTQAATREEVVPGTFYVDYANDQLYLGDDPTGRAVEATTYTQAFVPQRDLSAGAAGTVIRGLGFTHYADWGVQVLAPNVQIENSTFAWNGQEGLRILGQAGGSSQAGVDAVVRGNLFTANGRKGVGVGRGHGLLLEGNLLSYNNVERYSSTFDAAGTKIVRTADMVLRGNLVERNYGTGIWMDISCTRAVVVRNVSRYNRGSMDRSGGIFAELQHDSIIAFNVSHDNGTGIVVADSSNIRVYNNTLARNGQAIIVRDSTRVNADAAEFAAGITWITRDVVIKNNLFSDIRRTGPTGALFEAVPPAGDDRSEQMLAALDFNAYYRSVPSIPAQAVRWDAGPGGTVGYANVAAFRAAYPAYEANALVIDGWSGHPFFVDEAFGDYRLRIDSPAVYRGKPLPEDVAAAVGLPAGELVHLGALGIAGFDADEVPLEVNLATAPSFEGDAPAWVTSDGASIVNGSARSGGRALLLDGPGEGAVQTITGLVPGGTYVLTGWARAGTPGITVTIGVANYGGPELSAAISSTMYSSQAIVFTLGPDSTSVDIWVQHEGGEGVAFADDFDLFQVPGAEPAN